jgi:hypothetical protein
MLSTSKVHAPSDPVRLLLSFPCSLKSSPLICGSISKTIPLHYALRYITLNYIRHVTLRCITLHYDTLSDIAFYFDVNCSSLQLLAGDRLQGYLSPQHRIKLRMAEGKTAVRAELTEVI